MGKDIIQLEKKNEKIVIGLMSGTSVDGIDAALVKIRGNGLSTRARLLFFQVYPYPQTVRKKILNIFSPRTGTVDKICHLNFVLGELFAQAALKIILKANLEPWQIDLIGSHGQTIYHIPIPKREGSLYVRSTLQIGEPSVIAERTGITTVADFRTGDMAAGGQGAPLAAYVDYILFRDEKKTRAIQNIGGIGNITLIPAAAKLDDVVAFDTGPGNMIIDAVSQILSQGKRTYDKNGLMAAQGKVNRKLLKELMNHSYLKKIPPKTTGREEFGMQFARQLIKRARALHLKNKDLLTTVTSFTADSIYYAYENFILPQHQLDEIIISGGGSYNPTLLNFLRKRFEPISLFRTEDFGISDKAKEALIFAILANETISANPANVPSATGAKRGVILGKIIINLNH